jgi:hypothetical protein
MAKKKKIIPPPQLLPSTFYIHYDFETGNIVSVSNEKLTIHTHSLEITFEEYENFILNKHKLVDFKVEDDRLICTKIDKSKIKINKLKEINSDKTADIEIYYDNNYWTFLLNSGARQQYYDKKIINTDIVIFLTSANDRNYLINTFKLNLKELVLDKSVIPFTMEKDIDFSLITNSDLVYNLNKDTHE